MKKIYDFDSYIERRGTHCVKHDALKVHTIAQQLFMQHASGRGE